MNFEERPITFGCEGDTLLGVVTRPDAATDVGLLIVVGGPQYRVGSHRQFVLLARAVATAGFAAMRFDYRGMGDASGEQRSFETATPDILAAANALRSSVPGLDRIVLFGLCDAASAALIAAPTLQCLAGLILANPWVRTAESQNAAIVRHYYAERIRSARFWREIARHPARMLPAMVEFLRRRHRASSGITPEGPDSAFLARMLEGWSSCAVDRLVLLSGRDLTAREFHDRAKADPRWSRVPAGSRCLVQWIDGADHTFSESTHRLQAERLCVDFLRTLGKSAREPIDAGRQFMRTADS